MKIRNIVSTLFLAETHYDLETLEAELVNLFSKEADQQAVSLFLNWFKQMAAHGRIDPEDYQSMEYTYRNREEFKTMLVTAIKEERRRVYQSGLLEGKLEGKIETAKEMLAEGMEVEFISRMTKLPDAQILQLRDGIASIKK